MVKKVVRRAEVKGHRRCREALCRSVRLHLIPRSGHLTRVWLSRSFVVALTNGKALPHKAEISWSPTLWNSWEIRGFGDRSNEINEGEMPSEILENRKFGSCGSY